jgi:hypothetical protein
MTKNRKRSIEDTLNVLYVNYDFDFTIVKFHPKEVNV